MLCTDTITEIISSTVLIIIEKNNTRRKNFATFRYCWATITVSELFLRLREGRIGDYEESAEGLKLLVREEVTYG